MLFVELALIRWTGSNVIYLSYFSNFVLLGSFLGIGVGFLRANAKVNLFRWAPLGLAALIGFVHVFPVKIDRSSTDLLFFGEFQRSGLPIWATLPVIFVVAALVMAMIAEGVARTFVTFAPLEAYRLDILGSIAGIAAFSLLSFTGAPPVVWGIVVAITFAWLLGRELKGNPASMLQAAALLALVLVLSGESLVAGDYWSPYYKISLRGLEDEKVWVLVNGIPHQLIESTEQRRAQEPFYFLPYEHRTSRSPPENVLIIGAGTGSDAAIALSQGAGHVDAVEIDPRLAQFGRAFHPDRPYDDPRVDVIVNDGRAFLEQTDRTYDMILFALPDSLTLVSGQSSLRLESYLFTIEAIGAARDHLAPGGVFAMYNYYRQPWLVYRLANTLQQAFGNPPCVDSFGKPAAWLGVLEASSSPGALTCDTRGIAGARSLAIPPPATDDHPFLYLRGGFPGLYVIALGLILLVSLAVVRATAGPFRGMSSYLDLFFMGAAFLLIETKNVVQFALLFGTTWFVNALVFAGILVTVLAAVEVARRVRFARPARLYVALVAALGVAWIVPSDWLLALPAPARFVAAVLIAFSPVFLANLVFAERFRDVSASGVAFGANLLGAMVGGMLEYTSLVIGYRSLLLVAAALYGLAFAFGRSHLVAEAREPAGTAPG